MLLWKVSETVVCKNPILNNPKTKFLKKRFILISTGPFFFSFLPNVICFSGRRRCQIIDITLDQRVEFKERESNILVQLCSVSPFYQR